MQYSDLLLDKNHKYFVVNKPAGLPAQNDKSGDTSLMSLSEIYFKHKVFPVHRIDRPVSGIVLFGKDPSTASILSGYFHENKIMKIYLAMVEGQMSEQKGVLKNELATFNKRINKSFVGDQDNEKGQTMITEYEVLGQSDHYTLVQIRPLTGRHHQIRAQLAHVGCPIKGDVKYGARRNNKDRSIHLHAWKLFFPHPVSGEPKEYIAPLPVDPLWDFAQTIISNQK